MANTYLTRTPSSTGNRQIFTFSAWVKRSSVTTSDTLFYTGPNAATSGMISLRFTSSGTINVYQTDIGSFITTNRLFRDTSAWYHIVLAIDTTQATPDDRRKLYINGVQETSFSTSTEINRNLSLSVNTSGQLQRIGTYADSSGTLENQFNGSMSHIHLIDGTAYDATAFGQYDANGVWTIKTSPSVTYGTNGFFILKDGNSVTDQSGEGNNFTVGGGTLTKTEDNPSNVFATGNRLNVNAGAVGTFSNGNNTIKVANSTGSVFGSSSTLGMTTGKFYCEVKIITRDSTMIGVSPSPSEDARNNRSPAGGGSSGAVGCLVESGNKYVSDNGSTYGAATAEGGIMMIALDLDNLKVYFGSGGQWSNGSGAWNQSGLTSGAALSITAVASTAEGAYFFSFGDGGGIAKGKVAWNFGNGYFETTAVSSAGTNASGNGIFEYDVPTGYTALSTKGLNL